MKPAIKINTCNKENGIPHHNPFIKHPIDSKDYSKERGKFYGIKQHVAPLLGKD
jgi:hypothetical protein